MDKEVIGMYGANCGICEWKEKSNCLGCQICKGEMFYGEHNLLTFNLII